MTRESILRLIVIYAISIAVMVQGITPDANSLVSPLLVQWLYLPVEADGPDGCHGWSPDKDRPAPSDDLDDEATPDDVVVIGEPGAAAARSRRIAKLIGCPDTATAPVQPVAGPGPLIVGSVPRRSAPDTDLTSLLGRLTC